MATADSRVWPNSSYCRRDVTQFILEVHTIICQYNFNIILLYDFFGNYWMFSGDVF